MCERKDINQFDEYFAFSPVFGSRFTIASRMANCIMMNKQECTYTSDAAT